MVSEKTLKWTVWIIRVACSVRAFPAIWDPQEFCVRSNYGEHKFFLCSNKSVLRFKIGTIFQVVWILGNILIISLFTCFLIFSEHNAMDLYLSIIALFVASMSLVAQINFYYLSDDIFGVFNSILVLDKRLRK